MGRGKYIDWPGVNYPGVMLACWVSRVLSGVITETGVRGVEKRRRIWMICCRQTNQSTQEIRHHEQEYRCFPYWSRAQCRPADRATEAGGSPVDSAGCRSGAGGVPERLSGSLAGQWPGSRGSQWLSAGARDSDRDWACDREDTQGACQGWDAGYLSLGADTALCSQGPLARSGAALALFEGHFHWRDGGCPGGSGWPRGQRPVGQHGCAFEASLGGGVRPVAEDTVGQGSLGVPVGGWHLQRPAG